MSVGRLVEDDPEDTPAERLVGTWLLRGVGGLLVFTVARVLLAPANANLDYNRALVVVGLGLTAAIAFVARWWGWRLPLSRGRARRTVPPPSTPAAHRSLAASPPRGTWIIAAAVSAIGGVAAYALAQPIRFTSGWDPQVVTTFSRELYGGEGLSTYAHHYLSRYPNNVPLVGMMNVAREVGGAPDIEMYTAYLVGNAVCLTVTMFATFALVARLRGTRAAWIAQGIVFVLVGCSPWMAATYTDLPAMPFVTVAVTLGALAVTDATGWRSRWRLILVLASAMSTAIAFVIKSTPATTALGLGLVLLFVVLLGPRPGRRAAAVALVGGTLTFALTSVVAQAVAEHTARVDRASLDTSHTPPLQWWLANGLTTTTNENGAYYGGYSPEMVADSMHLSGEELRQWSERRLADQISALGAGGILVFESRKLAFNWGDGMFLAWGSYDWQPDRLHRHDPLSRSVQTWHHAGGSLYDVRAALTNGLWLAVVLHAGLGLLVAPYRRSLVVVAVSVVGIALFTLAFQGASRYLLTFVPVIVALSACVDPFTAARSDRLRS